MIIETPPRLQRYLSQPATTARAPVAIHDGLITAVPADNRKRPVIIENIFNWHSLCIDFRAHIGQRPARNLALPI